MAEVLPKSFGRYRVVERIAEGGMADIFRARLDGIGGFQRSWAIKRVRPHLSGHGDYTDLLVEEAKIGGLLNHANIVVINEMGEQDGQLYLVMEFVDGPDLARVLQRCRDKGITLPLPEAVFIAI